MRRNSLAKRLVAVASSLALALALVLVAYGTGSSQGSETGVEDGFNYTVNSDGTATVTGYEDKAATDLTIPSRVAGHAVTCMDRFSLNGTSVEKITLPSTLVCVGIASVDKDGAVSYIQAGFVGASLKTIAIDGTSKSFTVVDDVLYTADMRTLVCYPGAGKEEEPNFTVPEGVEEFAGDAVNVAPWLQSIQLPASFKSTFNFSYNSPRLTAVTVDQANPYLSSDDGILYNKGKTSLLIYPRSKAGSEFTIPDGVKSLGYLALYRQVYLEKVVIGSTLSDLGSSLTECDKLHDIIVDDDNPHFAVKNGVLLSKDLSTLLVHPAGLQVKRFEIPSYVSSIGQYAFGNCTIETVVVPSSVKTLHWSCFWSRNIGTVYVSTSVQRDALLKNPNSINNNPNRIFLSEIKTGVVEASVEKLPKAGKTVSVAASTGKVRFTVLSLAAGKSAKGMSAMASKKTKSYTGAVRIDYYPTGKGGTVNLKAVRLHGTSGKFDVRFNVTEVAAGAFKGRKDVKSVALANVEKVGSSSFQGCRNLKAASLGSALSTIGTRAFQGCKNLKSVRVASKKLKAGKVGASAFKGTSKKMLVKAPKAKLSSYRALLRKAGAPSGAKFARI